MPNLLLEDTNIQSNVFSGMGLFIITTDYMSLDIKNVLPALQGSSSLAWKKTGHQIWDAMRTKETS